MSDNVIFTANQIKFIEWLATPKFERSPPKYEDFAQELGVNVRTLYRWKKEEELLKAVVERARELLQSDLPDIYGALRREAIKGQFQHIKLALEMLGEYTEKIEHSGKDGGPLEIKVVYESDSQTQEPPPGPE